MSSITPGPSANNEEEYPINEKNTPNTNNEKFGSMGGKSYRKEFGEAPGNGTISPDSIMHSHSGKNSPEQPLDASRVSVPSKEEVEEVEIPLNLRKYFAECSPEGVVEIDRKEFDRAIEIAGKLGRTYLTKKENREYERSLVEPVNSDYGVKDFEKDVKENIPNLAEKRVIKNQKQIIEIIKNLKPDFVLPFQRIGETGGVGLLGYVNRTLDDLRRHVEKKIIPSLKRETNITSFFDGLQELNSNERKETLYLDYMDNFDTHLNKMIEAIRPSLEAAVEKEKLYDSFKKNVLGKMEVRIQAKAQEFKGPLQKLKKAKSERVLEKIQSYINDNLIPAFQSEEVLRKFENQENPEELYMQVLEETFEDKVNLFITSDDENSEEEENLPDILDLSDISGISKLSNSDIFEGSTSVESLDGLEYLGEIDQKLKEISFIPVDDQEDTLYFSLVNDNEDLLSDGISPEIKANNTTSNSEEIEFFRKHLPKTLEVKDRLKKTEECFEKYEQNYFDAQENLNGKISPTSVSFTDPSYVEEFALPKELIDLYVEGLSTLKVVREELDQMMSAEMNEAKSKKENSNILTSKKKLSMKLADLLAKLDMGLLLIEDFLKPSSSKGESLLDDNEPDEESSDF
jgi:hypothetical protein